MRLLFYIAFFLSRHGWVGGLVGTIGIVYLGAPEAVQASIRGAVPEAWRLSLLELMSFEQWLIMTYVVTLTFAIWGATAAFFSPFLIRRENERLKRENDDLRYQNDTFLIDCYDFFSRYLVGYFSKLRLGAEERVNLYRLDADMFICIGRYSDNEDYRKKPSRVYPVGKGCIAETWRGNKYQDSGSPDPAQDLEKYYEYQAEKFGFDRGQLIGMNMKSRSYSGIRIKNPHGEALAVLIFESTQPSGLPFGKIDRLVDLNEQRRLGALIHALESHMPSLTGAEQEGF